MSIYCKKIYFFYKVGFFLNIVKEKENLKRTFEFANILENI